MSTTLDAATAPDRSPAPGPRPTPVLWQLLRPIASLQLTVGLFAVSMLLVFFGTLAQVDKGIWTVVEEYFRSWYVFVPTQLIATFGWKFFETPGPDTVWTGSFPLPGGWTIGTLMLVNLLAAHLVRFKLSWRRAGVITIHLGVVLLLAGELVTGLFAVESRMVLQVGETGSYFDHARQAELAFTNPAGRTVTVPHALLARKGLITHPDLPVDVEVTEFHKNTVLKAVTGGDDAGVVVSAFGGRLRPEPVPEGSGVKSDQKEDMTGVRARLLRKGTGEVLVDRLFTLWDYRNTNVRQFSTLPVTVAADGGPWTVGLRSERIEKPYTLELLRFEHAKYAGTTVAKDYASTVRLVDPETGDDRQVRIWMNHPLRHRGITFYQAGTLPGDTGTVLQVVRNPGWLLPYLSCAVVTLGMLIHFGTNLSRFTSRRAA